MARKKINWLLILQGWAMLWVVIGHSPLSLSNMPLLVEHLFNIAYSFHMPLFILVSGYLFQLTRLNINQLDGWGGYWNIMRDKLQRLGIPFIVFTIVALAVKVMFPGDVSRQTSLSFHEFFMAIINPFDGPNNEMWFVGMLLWFFAFTPLWHWSCQKKETEWLLLTLLILLHLFHPNENLFCIRQICTEAVFFYSGILVCKYGLDDIGQKNRWYLLLGGLIGFVLCYLFSIRFIAIWCGIAFSAGLAFILDEYVPKAFCGFRDYTYQIFLMGIFVQIAVKIIYKYMHIPYLVGYLVCLTLGLYVPVIISKIIEKLNWKPLLLCIGLKNR